MDSAAKTLAIPEVAIQSSPGGRRGRKPWDPGRELTGVVVLALLAFAIAGPSNQRHVGDEDLIDPPPWLSQIVGASAGGGDEAFTMRAVVAVDDGFVRAFGQDWDAQARSAVLGASGLLSQLDVALDVTGVRRWDSSQERLPRLVDRVVSQVGLPGDAVLVGLTSESARGTPDYDGWASATRPVIVVRVTDPVLPSFSTLVAHELGHMLGLLEHEPGHDCSSGGCVMAGVGYRNGSEWCSEHAEAVASVLRDPA